MPAVVFNTVQWIPTALFNTVQWMPAAVFNTIQWMPTALFNVVQWMHTALFNIVQWKPTALFNAVQWMPRDVFDTTHQSPEGEDEASQLRSASCLVFDIPHRSPDGEDEASQLLSASSLACIADMSSSSSSSAYEGPAVAPIGSAGSESTTASGALPSSPEKYKEKASVKRCKKYSLCNLAVPCNIIKSIQCCYTANPAVLQLSKLVNPTCIYNANYTHETCDNFRFHTPRPGPVTIKGVSTSLGLDFSKTICVNCHSPNLTDAITLEGEKG